ncbi:MULTISPECIES: hypothetical protein [Capnocytophaga]|jgi:hypothetical protein|uniref:DUF3037 domain-containing protein n=1 Tax=Capnocytophaga periodontitidis TaxID=2795027 RepID=A0ABS0SQJ9_9FLAO|nr:MULTISPECIES: hypothetical protein [Capnocytophaga]EKY18495.1 hypothetical protein HMPREF9073_01173 [Capnocytophaga sp. oral taxon 326 str. F0382]MBI1648020.1 hypothetical protein [Capnocytophaga periodontitidis]MBI1669368.1 hypothetical protein [Capnocytophaga periodontitidis]MBM0653775.1 hypothetical protein [Capnocytophaga genosp. AHN8471]MBM0656696.1 hypothetical protein [Capnocytophaga genosp. AHN8471]
METLYCPIYLSTNALSSDRFSVGLIMANNDTLFFNYSDEKLTKVKHLFTNEAFLIVKQYLKSLYKSFNTDESDTLFARKEMLNNWVNKQYLSYLGKYSNNLIQFGETTIVDIELNEDIFKKFFEMYVFRYPVLIDKEKDIDILKKPQTISFYEEVSERVNIDREITNKDLNTLLIPTKVGFIGKNEVPTAGDILNLKRNIQTISNNINSFISLTKALNDNQNKKGKYYLIGEEPDKKLKENHHLWNNLRNTKIIDYVELQDIGEITSYFTQHQVTPFFAD